VTFVFQDHENIIGIMMCPPIPGPQGKGSLLRRLVVPTVTENGSFHRNPRSWFDSVVTEGKMFILSVQSVRNRARTARSTWQNEFSVSENKNIRFAYVGSGTLLRDPSASKVVKTMAAMAKEGLLLLPW
jgi:hypothetical protein